MGRHANAIDDFRGVAFALRLDNPGVVVAETHHAYAGREIEKRSSVGEPDFDALSALDVQLVRVIS
jgi:hypothetical protein